MHQPVGSTASMQAKKSPTVNCVRAKEQAMPATTARKVAALTMRNSSWKSALNRLLPRVTI